MSTLRELQTLYRQGMNITQLLREEKGLEHNTDEIIETAYDLQAGSYTSAMGGEKMAALNREYTAGIAQTILSVCEPLSLLEAGVGEATTLAGVLQKLDPQLSSFGFDLSWSRVAFARRWLQEQGIPGTTLVTGNLFHIPFADNSVDVVFTSHAIEPNGGNEVPILRELSRVAGRFLVLVEPDYEHANEATRQRMDHHGYCKDLKGAAESLGLEVIRNGPFEYASDPTNPSGITIIRKPGGGKPASHILACPKYKTPLEEIGGMMFSPEALSVYPIVGGIPCLRIDNAVLASQFKEFVH